MSIDFSVLIWTVVNFLLLMVLLNQFLYKPIRKFMKQRQEQIDQGIEAGKQAQADLEAHKAQLEEQLQEFRNTNQQARQSSGSLLLKAREEAITEAEAQAAQRRQTIQAELQEEEQQLTASLSEDVPVLVAILSTALARERETKGSM